MPRLLGPRGTRPSVGDSSAPYLGTVIDRRKHGQLRQGTAGSGNRGVDQCADLGNAVLEDRGHRADANVVGEVVVEDSDVHDAGAVAVAGEFHGVS